MGGFVSFYVDRDETLNINVDWTNWLNGATITSSVNEVNGPTVGSITTASNVNTFSVSGNAGRIQHRITDSAGQTKELRIRVSRPDAGEIDRDYTGCR
jgi:hypothetical protein